MLKSKLEHLNYIWESDASRCTTAETAISNLETEHRITIKGSREPTVRKAPPLSVQQFQVQVTIPYLDRVIANITSTSQVRYFSLLCQPLYNPALLPDDMTFQSLW